MEDTTGLQGGWGHPGEGLRWQAHREATIYQEAQKDFRILMTYVVVWSEGEVKNLGKQKGKLGMGDGLHFLDGPESKG